MRPSMALRPRPAAAAALIALGLVLLWLGTACEIEVCSGGDRAVVLVVDPSLLNGIRPHLSEFEGDLCNEGYTVIEKQSGFATAPELRAYLADLYSRTQQRLTGAILIGDQPHAYQWVTLVSANPQVPPLLEEAISFQYYADLDGVFETSRGYASPGGHPHSYDVHKGAVDWEIWIGVLPSYKGDPASTTEAINRYFVKNHAYRIGALNVPRAFLQVNEHFIASTMAQHDQFLSSLRSGPYAWTPFSDAPTARLYFDSPPGGLSAGQGYADLTTGLADFTVVDAHGSWQASGDLSISWVEANPVRTAFFWSNGCAVGDLDHPQNFLASLLYSPTSMVVAAKGTTNNSGGMGTNQNGFFGHNIASALSGGASFGEAILGHVNVPLIQPWADSREFHFGTSIILGDPTLGLRR